MSDPASVPSARGATPIPRWFTIGAILLMVLMTALLGRGLTEPMIGFHSLGAAHDAWVARSHVVYGLGYTKGFDTFALGHPPPAQPTRYLDHPVLFTLANSLGFTILGVHDWTLRVMNLLATLVALWLLLGLLRRLTDPATALVAGLFFCMFPIIAFFGVNMWLYPLAFFAYTCYLALIGALPDVAPRPWRRIALGVALFLAILTSWEGVFFAAAIALHFVARAIRAQRARRPIDRALLAIVLGAPAAGLLANGLILAAGHDWNFGRLVELARWRMTSGEFQGMGWSQWFGKVVEHAVTNFTFPVLVVAVLYGVARLIPPKAPAAIAKASATPSAKASARASSRRVDARLTAARAVRAPAFPQFWLFFLPPMLQLFVLRGMLPAHVWWERPFAPFIAILLALWLRHWFERLRAWGTRLAWAGVGLVAALLLAGCIVGTNYYYGIRWQRPEMIQMLSRVREAVPPEQHLLSFLSYDFNQKPGVKAASLRPEVAWYLDREIDVSRDLDEIDRAARSGKYSYYLAPAAYPRMEVATQLARLLPELRKRYRVVFSYPEIRDEKRQLPWFPREPRYLRPYRDGMLPHQLFDLRERIDGE